MNCSPHCSLLFHGFKSILILGLYLSLSALKHLSLLSGLSPIPSATREQSTGFPWVNMQMGAQGEFQLFHILHSGMTTDMKPQPVLHSGKPSPSFIRVYGFFFFFYLVLFQFWYHKRIYLSVTNGVVFWLYENTANLCSNCSRYIINASEEYGQFLSWPDSRTCSALIPVTV